VFTWSDSLVFRRYIRVSRLEGIENAYGKMDRKWPSTDRESNIMVAKSLGTGLETEKGEGEESGGGKNFHSEK